ncbi:hypothetical protein DID80_04025 [Candidatus Marinamargulisbacteria bacterium SCGC AAA071-K20]|nr:hypothetical protein DID80_04025 [Candidatus Marinamargulisbacteria bacterium SCGC AAA071-K20]
MFGPKAEIQYILFSLIYVVNAIFEKQRRLFLMPIPAILFLLLKLTNYSFFYHFPLHSLVESILFYSTIIVTFILITLPLHFVSKMYESTKDKLKKYKKIFNYKTRS